MTMYLEKLLPVSALAFWYPMNDNFLNGFPANQLPDFSGNARSMFAANPIPIFQNAYFAPRNNLYFDGTANPLAADFAGVVPVKHIFVAAKYDGVTNFGAGYRGLISGLIDNNYGILTGNLNSTAFFNFGYSAGGYTYKKSGIVYAENNQQAPFEKIELLEISLNSGFLLDGFQVGRDRSDNTRRWFGKVVEPMGFTRVLTANESDAVQLYYDLKYALWRRNGTILNFPNPNLTGICYARFYEDPEDAKKVTVSHEYDDGGKSFNRTSDTAPRMWELEFNCVGFSHAESKAKTDIFDAFYRAVWFDRTFNFTDKYGETHSDVRIDDYNRSHQGHKSWSQNAKFRLVKLP